MEPRSALTTREKAMKPSHYLVTILMVLAVALAATSWGCGGDDDDDDDSSDDSGDDSSDDDSGGDDTTDDDATDDDATDDDTGGATFDLTFSGTGFGPHDGQTITVAVTDIEDAVVVATDSTTISGGAFSFNFPGILGETHTFHVDYYADVNGSDSCEAPPTDHAWRVDIPAVSADVDLPVTHNTDFTDVCGSF
jgi:hypothetical protein